MTTTDTVLSGHRDVWLSPRFWVILATATFGCLAIVSWIAPFGPVGGGAVGVLAAAVVTAVAGLTFLLASRRAELLVRLRQALALSALATLLVAAGNLLRFLDALGLRLPEVPGLDLVSTVVIWAIGFAALLRLPLIPPLRGEWWWMASDTAIAVGGMTLAIFATWSLPGLRHVPAPGRLRLLAYNLMEAANLIVLNLILIRGPARAIRQGYWWLACTIVLETVYLVAFQYAVGQQSHDARLLNSLFFLDYLAYVYAGVAFLTRPQPETDVLLWPQLRAFNPLPVLAVIGVGTLLVLAARRPADPTLLPLAVGIFGLALILLVRVVGATGKIMRLLQEEAAEDRRRHSERQELMRRLAGGTAHIINNLMTVVIGHAEMMLERSGAEMETRSDARAISEAAHRAAALARRLLLASGRAPVEHERRPLAEAVAAQREALERIVGEDRRLVVEVVEMGGTALVSPAAVEAILRELVANAVEATGSGATITVRIRDETLAPTPRAMTLAPAPGRYAVLEVADPGRGIDPGAIGSVHEPFFTTRPAHEGRGLGVSVVLGIVAAAGGGLGLDSTPGAGTRVRVYLPIEREPAR